MIRSHKIRLDPNDKQATGLSRAAGCARFAWNYALSEWKRQYALGQKPSETTLRKQLNAVKREHYPWMLESTKNAPQQAIKNLGTAFKNFFKKRARYPRFKKKGIHDSFRVDNGPGTFETDAEKIRIPKIGWVRMREALRFEGRIISATVSRRADQWYVSIQVEVEDVPIVCKSQGTVGVDLGIRHLATLSTGEHIEGPKSLKKALPRLRRLNKSVSRKKKGSKNRQKAKAKLALEHIRISNIRNNFLHNLTTKLVRQFSVIVIEDLNVSGMMKNRHLSRAISDMGFFEFRRQLSYKGPLFGSEILVYPRFAPSSKKCSYCGYVIENLPLSIREWDCPSCGTAHDRDENAAKVLRNWAASFSVSACGEGCSGAQICKCVKRSSEKQEINTEQGMSLLG